MAELTITAEEHLAVHGMGGRSMDATIAELPDIDEDPTCAARTYLRTANFFAMVSLGSITPGHTLLCPAIPMARRLCANSLHDMASLPRLVPEFKHALTCVREVLSVAFGKRTIFYEHGLDVRPSFGSRCGTAFPHLHVLPHDESLRQSVLDALRFQHETKAEYDLVDEFLAAPHGGGEYLLVGDDDGVAVLWSGRNRRFPSQLVRHVVQSASGTNVDDWQSNPGWKTAESVAALLRSARIERARHGQQAVDASCSAVFPA